MPSQDPTEVFIRSLTENQNRLYGYIFSLVGDHHAAADVLQECNLVLWRKTGEFRAGSAFIPWAFGIARFQVLAHLRDRQREEARLLNPELVELLAGEVEAQAGQFEELRGALRHCVAKLPEQSRELVDRRYFRKHPVQTIADEMQRKLSAVKVALMRIRDGLRQCIEREMRGANAS